MEQEKAFVWIREPLLLLEIEKGNARLRADDNVPAVESRAPKFILHIFSDPDEFGERKTINVALSQSNTEGLMDAITQEIERFAKEKDEADKDLAGISHFLD